ncbi:MAG: NAD(+) diphosphatase [Candidatus Tectomicrobia bacterium]|uniref:NAD(+) diphosphatase n=1 Tax=Tectimicrobiota bacterium TaxID=2528274 RepID=A0A937VX64_UNCTE|nr:NAD(+) diphosphatase [Candidatus Tectomicrobia bacterium]
MNPHVFAGNPLDRGDTHRRDQAWLDAQAGNACSRFLPLWQLNVLIQTASETCLGWISPTAFDGLDLSVPPVFLGLQDNIPHFAVDVSHLGDPQRQLNLDDTWRFEESRNAATMLSTTEAGILAQSRAQLDWHRRHQFCSVCGQRTEQGRGGQVRKCTACKAEHFPRTDPVAIMVVTDGERCLLGQSRGRLSRTGTYSALAGFMDQGESIEEAVRREVKEEAGITVGDVRYHSSQPWPFPSSLMIGCHARALTTDIHIDNEEMTDVRWFARADVLAALRGEHPELRVPAPIAIAHHLIKAWAEGTVHW